MWVWEFVCVTPCGPLHQPGRGISASCGEPEVAVSEERKRALAAKEAGNEAYKKRDFETAIAKYNEGRSHPYRP